MGQVTLDTLWLILCGTLVLFMQPGFLGLESGAVRAKNNVNVAAKNLADFCIAALAFWAVGYGMMFGSTHLGLIGQGPWLASGTNGYTTAFIYFQVMFCSTAATIVSGAVAERITFVAYLCFALLLAGFVYPVFGHWAWGSGPAGEGAGWLKALGFRDFAGSTVVHSVGGWSALAAMIAIGPRIGRFGGNRFPVQAQGVPFSMLGVFLIFIGWIGFNGGSLLGFTDRVPQIILCTLLAGATGGAVTLLLHVIPGRPAGVFDIGNGVIGGLVAVTASADIVSPIAAVALGLLGGAVVIPVRSWLEKAEIDDAIGAVPAHLAPGVLGTLAVPFVNIADVPPSLDGLLHAVGVQFTGVVVCAAWSFGVVYTAVRLAAVVIRVRVDPDVERRGLNVAEHGVTTDMAHLIGRFSATTPRNRLGDLFDQADEVISVDVLDPAVESLTGFRDVLSARRWQLTTAREGGSTEERRDMAAVIERLDQDLRFAMEEACLIVSQTVGSDLFTLGAEGDRLGAARRLNQLVGRLVRDLDSLTARLRLETDVDMILGFVETARDKTHTFCRKVETVSDYCAALTSTEDTREVATDLRAAVREVVDSFRSQASVYNVLMATEIAPDVGAAGVAASVLRRVLKVVIENAIVFNRDGGVVQIAVSRDHAMATIEVTDSGIGMSDAEIALVEDPFRTPEDGRETFGLSLALVSRLMRQAGGELVIRSEKGVGTRVTARLPTAGRRALRAVA
ncbi:ammonium transporter [Methylobrevis albus]|uniref:Ammonium transporter n=1 Tax=Methylobrevis albus TaxID=2793297 RepID=A0A931MWZ9_9HYPH|nr:ammonium transporter [Methylobrevis albus]MBH0238238.1 ammonium transporter [Methylobrevis albus]